MKRLKLTAILVEVILVVGSLIYFDSNGWVSPAEAQAPVDFESTPAALTGTTVARAGQTISVPGSSRAASPNSVLGIAIERFTNEAGLPQLAAVNVTWSRREFPVDWRLVEPNEGQYNWAALADFETEMLAAQTNQMEPIIEIQFAPAWAQKVPGWPCGAIRADKFEAFANFVDELVTRYGSASTYKVRYWQIANEPDVAPEEIAPESWFGCWGDVNDPYFGGGYFAQMLKVVYPRIKAADPEAQVLLGGLLLQCNPYLNAVDPDCTSQSRLKSGLFFEGILREGGGEYFDAADVHSYADLRLKLPHKMHSYYGWSPENGGTGLPQKVAFMRYVLARYGYYDKPLFVGEIALKCEAPGETCYDVGAAFIPRVYAEAYSLDVRGAIYYALVSEFKYKGLLLPDLSPKPAYTAYKFMSDQLIEAQYERAVQRYPGVTGHRFKRADLQRIEILWSSDGLDQTITLPSNLVSAFDKLGAPLSPTANQLTAGWSPIYVLTEPLSTTLTAAGPATSLQFVDTRGLSILVEVPAGAVSQPIDLLFEPTEAKPVGTLAFAGHAFDLTAYQSGKPVPDFSFSLPLSVTIEYDGQDLQVIPDEEQLSLRRREGGGWVDAAQSCDPPTGYIRNPANHTLTLSICRSGQFALFGPTNTIHLPTTIRTS